MHGFFLSPLLLKSLGLGSTLLFAALLCLSCAGAKPGVVAPTAALTQTATPALTPVDALKPSFSTYTSADRSYQIAQPSTLPLHTLTFTNTVLQVTNGLDFQTSDGWDEVYVIPGTNPSPSFTFRAYLLSTLAGVSHLEVQSEATVKRGSYTWTKIDVTMVLGGLPNHATLLGQMHHGSPFMLEERFPSVQYQGLEKLIFLPMVNSFRFLK